MVTYGHEVTSDDDKLVDLVERTGKMMLEYGAAGSALVDFFPFRQSCRYLHLGVLRIFSYSSPFTQSDISQRGFPERNSNDTLSGHVNFIGPCQKPLIRKLLRIG
jgi:hypothetical protein